MKMRFKWLKLIQPGLTEEVNKNELESEERGIFRYLERRVTALHGNAESYFSKGDMLADETNQYGVEVMGWW
jgi:hypothetical protein